MPRPSMPIVALAIAAVGCGDPAGPAIPRPPPELELVGCHAAIPAPQAMTREVEGARDVGHGDDGAQILLASNQGPPRVSIGRVRLGSGLSPTRVMAALRTRLAAFAACFPAPPPSRVTVIYRLTIEGTGAVSRVDASTVPLPTAIDRCVRRVLRATVFPRSTTGRPVIAGVPIVFEGARAKPADAPRADVPWTPFAIDPDPPGPAAIGAARATAAAVRDRLGKIERCFARGHAIGSLRVMLELGLGGELVAIRSGGLGERKIDACVARALAGLEVVTPIDDPVEVACDLARGEARPWRVALDAGYKVIEIEPTRLRHGDAVVVPGASDPAPLPAGSYVVVARPDTPGAMLELALMWANDASVVLLALRDGTGAPRLLGFGDTAVEESDDDEIRASLRINRRAVTGCVGRARHEAPIADGPALDRVLRELAERCRAVGCAEPLLIGIDSDAVARDLVEITSAARRAGFARVLLGGSDLGCAARPPARKPAKPRDDDGIDL